MIHGIIPVSGGSFGSNLGASFWSNDSLDDIKEDEIKASFKDGILTLNVPKVSPSEKLPEKTLLGDKINMAFASTLAVFGSATGVVVSTGDNTEIGKISQNHAK